MAIKVLALLNAMWAVYHQDDPAFYAIAFTQVLTNLAMVLVVFFLDLFMVRPKKYYRLYPPEFVIVGRIYDEDDDETVSLNAKIYSDPKLWLDF